jgi:hypothetical protein
MMAETEVPPATAQTARGAWPTPVMRCQRGHGIRPSVGDPVPVGGASFGVTTEWSNMTTDNGFLPIDDEQRREFLMLLASDDGILKSLTEDMEQDALPFAVRAMAVELVKTSVTLMELEDEVAGIKTVLGALGGLSAGLLGLGDGSLAQTGDEDEDLAKFRHVCREQGAKIRSGAGLMPLVAS